MLPRCGVIAARPRDPAPIGATAGQTAAAVREPGGAQAMDGPRETWIRFMAPVVPQTATALLQTIDRQIARGVERIHLMISSPGGSVFHGLSIYNLLKGAPVEVVTYNFGSVDSIGVVIFCAGDRRISVPHARFLLHGVSLSFQGNRTFDEKDLEERLKGLRIDTRNISRVMAATTGRDAEAIVADMEARTTLDPEQAVAYGLVHAIRSELFPSGADLTAIYEPTSTPEPQPGAGAPPGQGRRSAGLGEPQPVAPAE
jgi:ATP-dependent Clp protease, protease subunit